jgi:hypothetical protein
MVHNPPMDMDNLVARTGGWRGRSLTTGLSPFQGHESGVAFILQVLQPIVPAVEDQGERKAINLVPALLPDIVGEGVRPAFQQASCE